MDRKKILIVFLDEWISYSPTILNIISLFKIRYEVEILTVNNGAYNNNYEMCHSHIININNFIYRYAAKLSVYRLLKTTLAIKYFFINLSKKKYDLVIGVDSDGYFVSKIYYKSAFYLSLEIKNDLYMFLSKILGIKNIVIQSKERLSYLNIDCHNVYILPNSPIVLDKTKYPSIASRQYKLLYLGNVIESHGLNDCINTLYLVDEKYTLTIKGISQSSNRYLKHIMQKHEKLIRKKRLIISTEYIPQEKIIDYVKTFYIGFCFYDFNLISKNDFNYISSPSGKLYNYLASGVPVIGSDIVGLKVVEQFETGRLIKHYSPQSILEQIKNIEGNYKKYVNNCIIASEKFEFSKNFQAIRWFNTQ